MRFILICFIFTLVGCGETEPKYYKSSACEETLENKLKWVNDSAIKRIDIFACNEGLEDLFLNRFYILANYNNAVLAEGRPVDLEKLDSNLIEYITKPANKFPDQLIEIKYDSATSIHKEIEFIVLASYVKVWQSEALRRYRTPLLYVNFCQLKTICKKYPIRLMICRHPNCPELVPPPLLLITSDGQYI